jgi:hypothetical protein
MHVLAIIPVFLMVSVLVGLTSCHFAAQQFVDKGVAQNESNLTRIQTDTWVCAHFVLATMRLVGKNLAPRI